MKKPNEQSSDEARSEYKRSDFPVLVRGKYTERLKMSTSVIVVARSLSETTRRIP